MPIFRTMVVAATLLLAVTACGQGNAEHEDSTVSQTENTDPEATLRSKPPFEQAQQEYREAVRGMADRISALVPGITWKFEEDSWRGCSGTYADTRGVQAYVYALFDGPVPDGAWDRAVDIVIAGTAELGVTDITTLIDKPGDHWVVLGGPDGVKIDFGTESATIFAAKSDCRLRQADFATPPTTAHR